MGYDLSNSAGTYVRFTGAGWNLALAVACHYGWEPAGISKPEAWNEKEHGQWEQGYWMNAGQQVTAADAAALTSALDCAVASSDFVDLVFRLTHELNEEVARHNPKWRDDLTAASREQAEGFRVRLIEFAELTRQGPFIID